MVLNSSIQLRNRSFHVMGWMGTAAKCTQMKNSRAKRANKYWFSMLNMQICDTLILIPKSLIYSSTRNMGLGGNLSVLRLFHVADVV